MKFFQAPQPVEGPGDEASVACVVISYIITGFGGKDHRVDPEGGGLAQKIFWVAISLLYNHTHLFITTPTLKMHSSCLEV